MVAHFPEFLLVMRKLLDMNFANIVDRSAAMTAAAPSGASRKSRRTHVNFQAGNRRGSVRRESVRRASNAAGPDDSFQPGQHRRTARVTMAAQSRATRINVERQSVAPNKRVNVRKSMFNGPGRPNRAIVTLMAT